MSNVTFDLEITCVEDVVKAILQKVLGLLGSALDHRVAVLPQSQASLITRAPSYTDAPPPTPKLGRTWEGSPTQRPATAVAAVDYFHCRFL